MLCQSITMNTLPQCEKLRLFVALHKLKNCMLVLFRRIRGPFKKCLNILYIVSEINVIYKDHAKKQSYKHASNFAFVKTAEHWYYLQTG